MSQTIADKIVTPIWQSLNTLSSIPIGTEMIVHNKSTSLMILAEGTQPDVNSLDGVPLTSYRDNGASRIIASGSLEIWVRINGNTSEGKLSVQEV